MICIRYIELNKMLFNFTYFCVLFEGGYYKILNYLYDSYFISIREHLS